MGAKGMKRLEIHVPEQHPIFNYPPGTRGMVAREWLDIGARIAAIEKQLSGIEDRLTGLERKVDSGPAVEPAPVPGKAAPGQDEMKKALMDQICNLL